MTIMACVAGESSALRESQQRLRVVCGAFGGREGFMCAIEAIAARYRQLQRALGHTMSRLRSVRLLSLTPFRASHEKMNQPRTSAAVD